LDAKVLSSSENEIDYNSQRPGEIGEERGVPAQKNGRDDKKIGHVGQGEPIAPAGHAVKAIGYQDTHDTGEDHDRKARKGGQAMYVGNLDT
jgi:hypothetical protein